MEVVDTNKLTPEKFEPVRRHRWVMMLEGVDAYMVNAVELPVIETGNSQLTMTLSLHNAVGDDQNTRLMSWLKLMNPRKGQLKFLDPVGAVTELWQLQVRPQKMWFDRLDYASATPLITHLALDVDELEITCPA